MLFAPLLLSVPLLAQASPHPTESPSIEQLVTSLQAADQEIAEAAAKELATAGVKVLAYLPDILTHYEERWRASEASFESLERVQALRLMIAASNQGAFDALLEQAGSSRTLVGSRAQHALAVLPENPAPELIRRWEDLDFNQRENCALAISMGGTIAAREHLTAIINGEFRDISLARSRAAMGLRQFTPEANALIALGKAAAEPNSALASGACTTLWDYGEAGVAGLVAALANPNPNVVDLASALLADLGPVAKGPVLGALIDSPRHLHLLRVARCVAPGDSTTRLCFLNLRGADDADLQMELIRSVPELELTSDQRIDVLGEALTNANQEMAREAALSCLRIPEHELLALGDVLMLAWVRPEAELEPLMAMAGAILRMGLSPEELLDWCEERMASPGEVGREVAGVLAGTLADDHPELLIKAVRHTLTAKQKHWLPHLAFNQGPADKLLLELVQAARPYEAPGLLRLLAMTGSSNKKVISRLRLALADPRSKDFFSVLRGLSMRGPESKQLGAALLKPFNDLRPHAQALALWGAARCDPDSKRLFATAKRALAESPSDQVRASAALVLARGTSSKNKRIALLREALVRRGQPMENTGESDQLNWGDQDSDDLLAQRLTDLHGPKVMGSIASALASLGDNDPATIEVLGDSIEGGVHQAMTVMESLRELNLISPKGSSNLTTLLVRSGSLVRASALRTLVEVEGANVHADVTLGFTALALAPEYSEVALNALEALTPEERPFSGPYLKCTAARQNWPLTGNGWATEELDFPWADKFGLKGALVPNLVPLKRFSKVRQQAAALLAKEN